MAGPMMDEDRYEGAASKPREAGEVMGGLERLQGRAEMLHRAAAMLAARVEPVLAAEETAAESPNKDVRLATRSTVGGQLQQLDDQLALTIRLIQETTDRVVL